MSDTKTWLVLVLNPTDNDTNSAGVNSCREGLANPYNVHVPPVAEAPIVDSSKSDYGSSTPYNELNELLAYNGTGEDSGDETEDNGLDFATPWIDAEMNRLAEERACAEPDLFTSKDFWEYMSSDDDDSAAEGPTTPPHKLPSALQEKYKNLGPLNAKGIGGVARGILHTKYKKQQEEREGTEGESSGFEEREEVSPNGLGQCVTGPGCWGCDGPVDCNWMGVVAQGAGVSGDTFGACEECMAAF